MRKKNNNLSWAFVGGWLGFLYYFYFYLYKEITFFVDMNDKWILNVLFITQKYLNSVLISIFSAFVLMTLNLLTLLFYHVKLEKSGERGKNDNKIEWLLLLTFILGAAILSCNIIGIYYLIAAVTSFTVVYTIYSLSKHLYSKETEEVVTTDQMEGPFKNYQEADAFRKDFLAYWEGKDNDEIIFFPEVIQIDNDVWFVSIKKTENR